MDIRNLTTFVHVAELGNFSRAAERLGYSQPTISVQIRQLEEELGFRVFDRIGHAVRLTDKGREILGYAQQVCILCQQIVEDTQEEERETLIRVATSDSLRLFSPYSCTIPSYSFDFGHCRYSRFIPYAGS